MRLGELGLLTAEFTNFQKLRYFGLAHSAKGVWSLTDLGFWFLGNRQAVPHHVFTRAGNVVDKSDDVVMIRDVDTGWWWKIDYANAARAVNGC